MAAIAILGATGHIGRSLAAEFAARAQSPLTLYGRDGARLAQLAGDLVDVEACTADLAEFPRETYDVIINALGWGDPLDVRKAGAKIVAMTAAWDETVIRALETTPEALYVAISSGAVYGAGRSAPVDAASSMITIEDAQAHGDHYAEAKLRAEARHRALGQFNIVDLRLYGYVSRFLEPRGGYFLSQVLAALDRGTVLDTHASNMVRDYVSERELADLVTACYAARPINRGFDVFSTEPVAKFDLLAALARTFGLQWRISDDPALAGGAVEKLAYFSLDRGAAEIGYAPDRTAEEIVLAAVGARLEAMKRREGAMP